MVGQFFKKILVDYFDVTRYHRPTMKRLLFCILYVSYATTLLAQKDSVQSFKLPRALIKISPLQFFAQTFELGIETFNKDYSKSLNMSAGLRTGSESYDDGSGANLEFGYRKYAAPMKFRTRNNHNSYQGVYYSLFIRGEYFKGTTLDYNSQQEYTEKILSIAPGFTIGFQKTLWQIIVLDIYVGGGIKFTDIEQTNKPNNTQNYYSIFDPGYSGIYPKTGVKIGIGL